MNSRPSVKIKSLYNTFNDTDQKIAKYILDNPKLVVNSSISQVEDDIQISKATIFRFCKKIGYKGFQDFKIALALDMDDGVEHYADQRITKNDNSEQILNKVFSENIKAISDSLLSIEIDNFEEAVEAFLTSRKIVFLGSGGSGLIAEDAHHKFIRTNLDVSTYTDLHIQLMAVSQLTPEDLIVVISHTGSNLNMIQVLEIAKERNIKTIGITSYKKSPVNDLVDIPLYVISNETKYQFEAFSSRLAHLSILDALYVCVRIKNKELVDKSINDMRHAISSTRI